jgi:hypothetical protein
VSFGGSIGIGVAFLHQSGERVVTRLRWCLR